MRPITCRAILFDMDGTLVDSTACVESMWRIWADPHRIPLESILAISHGRRSEDTIRQVAPHLDAVAEAAIFKASELQAREGNQAVPGAAELLGWLPENQWAVVTSASRELATLRLELAGLPIPRTLVPAEDVAEGKPSPAGYLRAAAILGVSPADCLVFEDTPPGIQSARAAGMHVIALTTTYPDGRLDAECIRDFRELSIAQKARGIRVSRLSDPSPASVR